MIAARNLFAARQSIKDQRQPKRVMKQMQNFWKPQRISRSSRDLCALNF